MHNTVHPPAATKLFRFCTRAVVFTGMALLHLCAQATTVQFETSLGNFNVVLFDNDTPITTTNFLEYVESERYHDTIIHRIEPGAVVQGGGFRIENDTMFSVTRDTAIDNEAFYSNERGTIAMAKLNMQPNSATSQWFINLANNGANFDYQNEGFTVFGKVMGSGMAVVDAMATLEIFSFGQLNRLPLRNYTAADIENREPLTADNFLMIHSVSVIDADPSSADAVTKPALISDNPPPSSDSGGGAMDPLSVFGLIATMLIIGVGRRRIVTHA